MVCPPKTNLFTFFDQQTNLTLPVASCLQAQALSSLTISTSGLLLADPTGTPIIIIYISSSSPPQDHKSQYHPNLIIRLSKSYFCSSVTLRGTLLWIQGQFDTLDNLTPDKEKLHLVHLLNFDTRKYTWCKIFTVSNCPFLPMVSNCQQCQIVLLSSNV